MLRSLVKRLGVLLNEATIQEEAFRLGLAKTKDEITGAVKAQAVYSLILKQTAMVQGDAARTKEGYANSLRSLQAAMSEAATELGEGLLPASTQLVQLLDEVTRGYAENVPALSDWINKSISAERVRDVFNDVHTALDNVFGAVSRLADAVSGKLDKALSGVSERLADVKRNAQAVFDGMPQWAKDALVVGGTLTDLIL